VHEELSLDQEDQEKDTHESVMLEATTVPRVDVD
jgi:hypothetical protein